MKSTTKAKKGDIPSVSCCKCGTAIAYDESISCAFGRMCIPCAAEIVQNDRKAMDMRKMSDRKAMDMRKMKEEKPSDPVKAVAKRMEDNRRSALLAAVWGKKKITRLNKVIGEDYCGRLTVREFTALVLADRLNFPNGLDTPMCIGDFEGNFCTNVLSVTTGGYGSDHVCVTGDPHGSME